MNTQIPDLAGGDRVVASTVDSAYRCKCCGERFTSCRLMGEHECPAPVPAGTDVVVWLGAVLEPFRRLAATRVPYVIDCVPIEALRAAIAEAEVVAAAHTEEGLPESMRHAPGFDTGPDEGVRIVRMTDAPPDSDEVSW